MWGGVWINLDMLCNRHLFCCNPHPSPFLPPKSLVCRFVIGCVPRTSPHGTIEVLPTWVSDRYFRGRWETEICCGNSHLNRKAKISDPCVDSCCNQHQGPGAAELIPNLVLENALPRTAIFELGLCRFFLTAFPRLLVSCRMRYVRVFSLVYTHMWRNVICETKT